MKKKSFVFKFSFPQGIKVDRTLMTELFFDEHVEEIRQRLFQSCGLVFLTVGLALVNVKSIVYFLEVPVGLVKFFQSSPGEYFVATLKISLYTGLLFSLPELLGQLLFFVLPGLSQKEKKISSGLLMISCGLLFLGASFSYFVLIPAAVNFFITYGAQVIEPLWSFNEYFSFILLLLLSTGLIFQIPVLQVILSFLGLSSGQQMLSFWRYVLLVATIVGAILTPSVDPLTQLLLSGAIFFLYLIGSLLSIFLQGQFQPQLGLKI